MSVGQVGIMNHLMGAGGPHWCEDPVVDRENQVGGPGVVGPFGVMVNMWGVSWNFKGEIYDFSKVNLCVSKVIYGFPSCFKVNQWS